MAKAKKEQEVEFEVGNMVRFTGYSEEPEEGADILKEGEVYEVKEIDAENEGLAVAVANPDYNSKKKESDSNPKFILVDVFFEEVELAEDEQEEAAPAKAKASAKAKAKAEVADEEDEDADGEGGDSEDDEEEEEEAPAKGKAKAAAKPAAKGKAKAETKPATKSKPAAKADTKAKGKAKDEEEPVEDYMDLAEDQEDQTIVELVDGLDNEELLELVKETVEEESAIVFKLGGILYHVRKSGAYKKLNKKYAEKGGFGMYVEDQLDMKYRKAMYLIQIYYQFSKHGLSGDKVAQIGWAKAAKIAAVMDEDNAEELLEMAEKSTVEELSDNLSSIKVTNGSVGGTAGERVRFVSLKFRYVEQSGAAIEKILHSVADAMGFDGKDALNKALEHIVTEWAVEHDLSEEEKAPAKTASRPSAKAGNKAKVKA